MPPTRCIGLGLPGWPPRPRWGAAAARTPAARRVEQQRKTVARRGIGWLLRLGQTAEGRAASNYRSGRALSNRRRYTLQWGTSTGIGRTAGGPRFAFRGL